MNFGRLESREVKVDNVNVTFSKSVLMPFGVRPAVGRKGLLARFRHERKRGFGFFVPIAAHIRVRKVLVADGLNVLNIDDFAESARVDDVLDSAIIRRVAKD